jgi:hypothetical protein
MTETNRYFCPRHLQDRLLLELPSTLAYLVLIYLQRRRAAGEVFFGSEEGTWCLHCIDELLWQHLWGGRLTREQQRSFDRTFVEQLGLPDYEEDEDPHDDSHSRNCSTTARLDTTPYLDDDGEWWHSEAEYRQALHQDWQESEEEADGYRGPDDHDWDDQRYRA